MTNHHNRLDARCQRWLDRVKDGTEKFGGMSASLYMSADPADIRAVDRLIGLGLVERVPYRAEDPTPRVRIAPQPIRRAEAVADLTLIIDAAPRLLEALRPLAKIAELVDQNGARLSDDTGIWTRQSAVPEAEFSLTLGHCRAALAAVRAAEGE